MYLKQLILRGFKSFADRSVITLDPGICAIVGPNGSGKSNISDAVLWVLGERNAKNLRGQVMEDVIFAGSSARKSVSVAEVELVLDNTDGTLPVEYDEVSIARRMYRTGESEYLINGTIVRRMDVLDILHDTGLGTGTHSIISQGHLDSILQSKPEDRRALIEEAAGVLKHKQRKEKSYRKLEQMDQNLARVKDIANEVSRQLGPLERKAKRANTYKEASAELAELDLQLAVDDLRTLQTRWEAAEARETGLQEQLQVKRAAVKEAELASERIQDSISQQSTEAMDVSRKQRRASSCSERFLSIGALFAERQSAGSDRVGDLQRSIIENEAKRAAVYEQYDEAKAFADGMSKTNALDRQAEELTHRLEEAREAAHRCGELAQAESTKLGVLEAREANARQETDHVRTTVDEARRALDTAQEAERSVLAEIKTLENMARAAEASAGAARQWVTSHYESLAALSSSLRVDKGFEALAERMLAGDIMALAVEDESSARAIAKSLRDQQKKGEVVLLLHDTGVRDASVYGEPVALQAVARDGVKGEALIGHIQYPSELATAVEAILGDIVVCESFEDSLAASAVFPAARYVTHEGTVVWPGGKLTFGAAVRETDAGALARTRRLDELRTQYVEAQQETQRRSAELAKQRAVSQEAQQSLLSIREELATARGEAKAAAREVKAADDKVKSLEREITGIARQKEQIIQQVEAYAKRIAESRARELARLEAADADARKTIYIKNIAASRIVELMPVFESLATTSQALSAKLEALALAAQEASAHRQDEVNAARAKTRAARDALGAVNAQLSDIRIEKGRLEVQVDTAVNAIVHDCKSTMEDAIALPQLENRPEVEERAEKLRRRIASLGVINPDAAQEYEALKVRNDYLTSQLEDLRQARASLAKIDRAINERMKDDFIVTFEEVNESFKLIFEALFPGGSGQLVLVDPEDMENTGVEVIAQPRGKKLTKMMLMSGGEKSLVALALLFAVYRMRATPFYILDEVEAALDDSNLRRLITYLEELRETTQLIMITHQRRTMEMADVLFGVSMQSDGITKVISQKLDRALQYAE